jgi:uracil-DNA glycosylase
VGEGLGAVSVEARSVSMDALVRKRKACRECVGLTNPSCVTDGALDSAELGPWTLWQGRLDAEVVVVGQDWGDVASFTKNAGFEEPGNPTNRRLVELLALAGVGVEPPTKLGRAGTAFLTNAILCLKRGGLQAAVRVEWFNACGARFLRPSIEIVRPLVVVALGTHATTAVCDAFAVSRPRSFRAAVDSPDGIALPGGTVLFPRYHCGARSTNMNRSRAEQDEDWRRLGTWLASHRQP